MIVCIQLPPRLLINQNHKSLTRRWLSCPGWGIEHVSLVFTFKGGQFIWKGQSRAKVNILCSADGYLNATMNGKPRNTEPEIGTDGSSQALQNPRVDGYGSGFGLPRCCGWGFWTVLESNRTVFPVQTRTAGGIPGPAANTTHQHMRYLDRLQTVVESNARCAWGWWWSELRDALGSRGWVSWQMNLGGHNCVKLEAILERVRWYTWRPWSSKLWDAPWGHDQVTLGMHLEAMITRIWRT